MLVKLGIIQTIIDDGYITSVTCENCNQTESQFVTINAQSFVFGSWLLPIKWLTWSKKVTVTCKNCKRTLNSSDTKGKLKEKVEERSNEFPLWKKNIPAIIMLFLFAITTINSIIYSIKKAFTSDEYLIIGHWNIEVENSKLENNASEKPINFINFYDDKTFSIKYFDDNYVSGRWKFNDEKKSIIFDNNDISEISVKNLSENNFIVSNETDKNQLFKKISNNKLILNKNDEDFLMILPYRFEFNKWRKKALKKENDLEIKNRVSNMLNYFEVTYQEAIDKKVNSIVSEKSTPFIVASNGVAIDENILWDETFYSNEDAQKGYELLKKSMPREMSSNNENIFEILRQFFKDYKQNLN